MVVVGRLAQHGGQDPQDGVAMARMLPGACLRLRDGRDPTPTGGGAALGALLVISVSETPQTELEVAPGPRGSRSAGEGPAPVSSLSLVAQGATFRMSARRAGRVCSSDSCGTNGAERGPSPGASADSQGQEEGPLLWESGFRSPRALALLTTRTAPPTPRPQRPPRSEVRCPCSRP